MNEGGSHVLLEVCVGSVADAEAAVVAGAQRLELCAGLEIGGLTPSLGLLEEVVAGCAVPVIAMLRPRAGGFCYDRHEFAAMLRDADHFLAAGAAGIAFGIIDREGNLDRSRSRELVERAGSRQTMVHRAFDFTSDQAAALEQLVELGVTRILSSGGQPTALAGAERLGQLNELAAGRIELMAGGGVNADNAVEIIRQSGVRQIHIGASAPADDQSVAVEAVINLNDQRFMTGVAYRAVVKERVLATVAAIRAV